MNFSQLYDNPQDFGIFSHQYSYFQYIQPPEPAIKKQNESFYVHVQNAPQKHWPAFVQNYRRRLNATSMDQRHQTAKKLKIQILSQRVDRLSSRLANVAKLTADYHEKRNSNWLAICDHTVKDMQEHVRRHKRSLGKRIEKLRAHNKQVKRRCELLRYRNYLTRIALQHEKRKRIGIF